MNAGQIRETISFYRGRSMEPTFRPGDILRAEKTQGTGQLRPGDIIIFKTSGPGPSTESCETVHRIIRSTPRGYLTRGDLNPLPDERPVQPEEVIGRIVRIERGGRVRKVRGGRLGLWRARGLWARRGIWRAIAAPLRPLYGRLRRSGLVAILWKPEILRIRFCSPDGQYVKYVRRGRTVAVWRPARNECRFRKPFDLVLWREIARERNRAAAEAREHES